MIRKLKVGEIIREGDFYTAYGDPSGKRESIEPVWNGWIIQDNDMKDGQIFREIPDDYRTIDSYGQSLLFQVNDFDCFKAVEIKEFAQWLLEIAEAME